MAVSSLEFAHARYVLRSAGSRFWLAAVMWSGAAALAIGIPTVLIPNTFFRRMTPVRWWDFWYWGVAAVLAGLTLAAGRLPAAKNCRVEGRALAGGGLTYLAVACPVCNKLVVAALGASGALTYFAPIQPLLGALGVLLLAFTLRRRLQALAEAGPIRAPQTLV